MTIVPLEEVIVRRLITFTIVVQVRTGTNPTRKVSIAVDGGATGHGLVTVWHSDANVAGHRRLLASEHV